MIFHFVLIPNRVILLKLIKIQETVKWTDPYDLRMFLRAKMGSVS